MILSNNCLFTRLLITSAYLQAFRKQQAKPQMDQSKRTKSDNKLLRKKIQNRKNSISRIFVGQSAGPKKIKIVDLRSQFTMQLLFFLNFIRHC